ncbi:MAG: hypothetical protein CM1200mP20_14580 [Pseudomonadota bacterium]|nr:MAG: hypothetical protein CM1200mP20_14580 [Pseudomonadota bacterium]
MLSQQKALTHKPLVDCRTRSFQFNSATSYRERWLPSARHHDRRPCRTKLAFDENGSVTAGTSSPLTDGAAATLVCSEDYAVQHGLDPIVRIKSIAVSGCKPETMGLGPIFASRKALSRAGLDANDIDVIEINEAFATQSIASIRDLELDIGKVNIDGGAIAIGHPLGATGARITGKAAQVLKRDGGRYALSTQCIGGGQGIATIMETL